METKFLFSIYIMNNVGVHEEIIHEHLADIYVYLHCVHSQCGLG